MVSKEVLYSQSVKNYSHYKQMKNLWKKSDFSFFITAVSVIKKNSSTDIFKNYKPIFLETIFLIPSH